MSLTTTEHSKQSNNKLTVSTNIGPGDNLEKFASMLDSITFANHLDIYFMGNKPSAELDQIVTKHNARLIPVPTPPVVEYIRSQQVTNSRDAWVLVMDFDEVVTPPLKKEITSAINSSTFTTFAIKRRNYSLGYPLRFGGWGDDYVIRLFKKTSFLAWPSEIHSTPQFQGQLGKLRHYLEHHKDESLEYIVNKTNRYTDQEATQFYAGGLPPVSSFTLLRKWKMEMIRRGFLKLGLLDGAIGLIQSIYQGYSVFLSWAKLFEKQQVSPKKS